MPRMKSKVRFPLQLQEVHLESAECARGQRLPEQIKLNFVLNSNVDERLFPELRVTLGLDVDGENDDIFLEMRFAATFGPVPGQTVTDRRIVEAFVNERAMYMLWPYVSQTVKHLCVLMGMRPIDLRTPYRWDIASTAREDATPGRPATRRPERARPAVGRKARPGRRARP